MKTQVISKFFSFFGRGFGGFFGKVFKLKFAYIFITFLFIEAIFIGVNSGGGIDNIFPILDSLGTRFFDMFQNIQSISNEVINNNAVFEGRWDIFIVIWELFSNLYLIYLWIKLFYNLWALMTNEYTAGRNLLSSLAILTFFIILILYLLLFVAPNSELNNFDLIKLPFTSIIDLFNAVNLIVNSYVA